MKKEKIEFISIIIYFVLLIVALILIAFIPSVITIVIFSVILLVGYFLIHLLRSILNVYTCPNCNKKFKIGVFKDIFSRNGGKLGKYIKCPHCKTKSWLKDE